MKYLVFCLCVVSSNLLFAKSSSDKASKPDPMKVQSHVLPFLQSVFENHKGALCRSDNRIIKLITSKLKFCDQNPTPKSCGNIPSGGSVSRTKWKENLVVALSNCQSEIQTAVCQDGTLSAYSGTFQYDSCQQGFLVPSIVSLKQTDIVNQLTAAGLLIGTLRYEESAQVAFGRSTRQSPAAGQLALADSPVDVWLSKGLTSTQDANSDGLRDDIEVYLNHEFPSTAERKAMLQLAKSSQDLLKSVNTVQEAQSLLLANLESFYCVKSLFGEAAIIHKANLDKAIFNSRDRFLTFAARQEAAGGMVLESRAESQYIDSCK